MTNYREIANKLQIAKKSIEYAANDLDIEVPETFVLDQTYFPNEHITSMFIPDKYLVVFRESWIVTCEVVDVILTSFHETRHAYQYNQIKSLKENLSLKEKRNIVIQWKKDFDNYQQPTSNSYEEQYISQSIEEDAINYAKKMIIKVYT